MTPSVTVVLPTLNERDFLRDCLDSLAAQTYPEVLEVLVVDGGSTDGTRLIAEAADRRVRVVENPAVTAAAAMNRGIKEARGEIICRADAHTLYEPDYVSRCVQLLLESGADNVGGPMRPLGTTSFGRAVAAVTTSPLGVGPGRFHYSEQREEVDTVYLGCWLRSTLEELGGYDETSLQWGAEDHELNLRIRQRGGRVIIDPEIRSAYFPRSSHRALRRQYFNYALGQVSTLAKHRRLPSWRPLAPALLVAATVLGAVTGRRAWRVAIPAAHAATCAAAAVRVSSDPGVAPHRAFACIEICHWSYGIGFWAGMLRLLRGRGFDARPRRAR